jgi:hypothetical protein
MAEENRPENRLSLSLKVPQERGNERLSFKKAPIRAASP